MQSGLWSYTSNDRQGSRKLVLAISPTGRIHAQKQRFNQAGAAQPTNPGDDFTGDEVKLAIGWLNEQHLQLVQGGWKTVSLGGLANTYPLSIAAGQRQRVHNLRAMRNPPPRVALAR